MAIQTSCITPLCPRVPHIHSCKHMPVQRALQWRLDQCELLDSLLCFWGSCRPGAEIRGTGRLCHILVNTGSALLCCKDLYLDSQRTHVNGRTEPAICRWSGFDPAPLDLHGVCARCTSSKISVYQWMAIMKSATDLMLDTEQPIY